MHWPLVNGLVHLLIIVQLAEQTKALHCLSCTDILQPRLCHQVETCSDDEVCVVQKLQYSNGDISFKVGCESAQVCHHQRSVSVMGVSNLTKRRGTAPLCVDCCTTDLCNAEGCGQSGYPPEIGVVCYGCDMTYTSDTCGRLEFCTTDEMCVIQGNWDIVKYYKTGCQRKHLCSQVGWAGQVGKRSNYCYRCCEDNLCNNRCDDNLTTSPITTPVHSTSISLPPITPSEVTSASTPNFSTLQPPKACDDFPECINMNRTAICADKHAATALCPRACGLCPSTCRDTSDLCAYLNQTISLCSNPDMVKYVGCLSTCSMCVTTVSQPVSAMTYCGVAPRLLRGDNKGVDFYVATFYLAKLDSFPHSQKPYLSILYEYHSGMCVMTYGKRSITLSLAYGQNVLPIPEELILTDPGLAQFSQSSRDVYHLNRDVEMKMLYLHCNRTVNVVVVQKGEVNGQASVYEAHLAFPAPQCSTSFVVSSYLNPKYEYNVIGVISPKGANVSFHNDKITTAPFNGTATFNVTLQSNGVFQLSSLNDLSGTRITSSTPICVLSSNNCLYNRKGLCSMVIESIPPVADLETNFVVPVLMPNYTMSIKIVAAHDNTSVTMAMTNQNANTPAGRSPLREVVVLNSGMYLTQALTAMTDLTIMATKGILVTQLLFGYAPFGLPVPAVTQYKDLYRFDSLAAKETYITIIIENMHNTSAMFEGLVLDDSPLSESLLSYNTTLACSDYSIITMAVSAGGHLIKHTMAVPFGLIVHGTQYGYPAGMKFMSTSK
ncbi:uncharacterized protein LOC110451038 isoform X2 [Mizuhopecten yessoensis]|uniref:uncharacterized protein LOC110451038 isoform X2 n=1 Tax=Mizuhopecten yessoensis TaxID=6573 RepID=UPI000B4578A2|nr:uncharacterized protein LOC110451038 isoform X2 [Mizuhopecten yessoensis]